MYTVINTNPPGVGEPKHNKISRHLNILAQFSDLRDSGGIENNVNIVTFMYRGVVYNPEADRRNHADLIAARHGNEELGEVTLFFQKTLTVF